jgi:Flp pilus assembly protein TadD
MILVLQAGTVAAEPGLSCGFKVTQYDPDQQQNVLLFADTSQLVVGVPTIGSLIGFSIDIEVQSVDSATASFILHLVTFGVPPNNYSRQYRVEFGVPARLTDIAGKGDVNYTLEIVPLEPVEIDTTNCGILHTRGEYFESDPSAHMDIFFVPQTHGDFYWNSIKGMMEEEYRRFRDLNHFNLPGKYSLYLCPCPIYSVLWDKRFGTVVDPTRSSAYTIYHKDINTTHPFVVLYASLLKNYGYSPPFLAEGFAGYLSDAPLVIKKLRDAGKLLPLDSLLDTYAYLQADPEVADRMAATFVRYLIEQYRADKFLDTYRTAHDLNIRETLTEHYGTSVAELEQEWLTYVDTLTVKLGQLLYYSNQAETLFDYERMLEMALMMPPLAITRQDSAYTLSQIVRGKFFTGDYYGAIEQQKKATELDPGASRVWMALAGYQMMNGYYDEALENLERAQSLDTSNQTVTFNLALNHEIRGDTAGAKELLSSIVRFPSQTAPRLEAQVMLANLQMRSDDPDEKAAGFENYTKAAAMLGQAMRSHNPSSQQQLWHGIAQLGLGEMDVAWNLLQTAMYLETRPFYLGFINLWLGKAADIRGDRAIARQYYGAVLSEASADYHQKEARRYLEEPYVK